MNKSKIITLSRIIFFIVAWASLGTLLFPSWWRGFFFEGGIFNPLYWLEGPYKFISSLFVSRAFTFGNNRFYVRPKIFTFLPTIILYFIVSALAVLFALRINRSGIRNVFSISSSFPGWKALIPLVISLFFAVGLLIQPEDTSSAISTSKEKNAYLNPPIDFIYIDSEKINSLFTQILPNLVIEKVLLEGAKDVGSKAQLGVENLAAVEINYTRLDKQTVALKSVNNTPDRQAVELLNFIIRNNRVKRYEHIQFQSDFINKLETAKALLNNSNIQVDEKNFLKARDKGLIAHITKAREEIENLQGLILVSGNYQIDLSKEQVILKHNFTKSSTQWPIYFQVVSEKSLGAIKLLDAEGETINYSKKLEVFGTAEHIEKEGDTLRLVIKPYAIW